MNFPKKIILLLTAIAALLPAAGAQKKPYKGTIRIDQQSLRQQGDSLSVRFVCDAADVKVSSRQSIEIVPLLAGTDTCVALPVIAVRGRANYLMFKRQNALAGRKNRPVQPFANVKGYKNKDTKQVEYTQMLAFMPWMKDAGLVVKEDLCGCGVTHTLGVSQQLAAVQSEPTAAVNIPQPFIPHLTYVTPEPVSTHREIASEAALDFVVSKTDIRPDYMNNAAELEKIEQMMRSVQSDPRISVRSISVLGYASPEGILIDNKQLSEGRANALANYLAPRYKYPRDMYHVVFGGENWEGLRAKIAASDMSWKERALQIIDDYPLLPKAPGETSRKRELMNFKGGNVYNFLVKEYCPDLRKAICKIEYDVEPIDARNVEQILATQLQYLNASEINQTAHFYGEDSPRFAELLQTAARMYPDDGTANLNAAVVALRAGDADAAEDFLHRARTDCPEYDNARGMLMILREDGAHAAQYFGKAAKAGLEAAASNLKQLEK